MMPKVLLTVADAAEILGINKNKMYELVKTPGFPVLYIGKCIRIPHDALMTWIYEQSHGGNALSL